MTAPIITLTTDFGLRDPYVAEMKAVILGICPKAVIVDITHQIEKFNVRMGAFTLAATSPYFPRGTIHVAVVDPGVGTERKPILIQAKSAFLVGPNNGILTPATKNLGLLHAYKITKKKMILPEVSRTFHGRDIFAPAAAHLASGISPRKFGSEIPSIATPRFAEIIQKKNEIIGEVLYVDDFGNIITNITEAELETAKVEETIHMRFDDAELELNLRKTYAEAKPKEPFAIIGSHNFVEISVGQGNAAQKLKTKPGDKVTLHLSERM